MIFYFETSAVNKFFENRTIEDAIATKQLQKEKGRKWRISVVTLWELFLTNEKEKHLKLFDFCRCLFDEYLMPSPEELIVNYLNSGCPIYEKKYPLISKSLMAYHWEKATLDKTFYFKPSKEDLHIRTHIWRMHGKFIDNIIRKVEIIHSDKDPKEFTEVFIQEIYESLNRVKHTKIIDEQTEKTTKIAIFNAMIILCWATLFNQNYIEQFWATKQIDIPKDRARYIAKNYPELFYRGPIASMARTTYQLCKTKYTRGAFFILCMLYIWIMFIVLLLQTSILESFALMEMIQII